MGTFLIVCFICFIIYQIFKSDGSRTLDRPSERKQVEHGSRNKSVNNLYSSNNEPKASRGSFSHIDKIASGERTQKLTTNSDILWVRKDRPIKIQGYHLVEGLIYVGENLSTIDSRSYWREVEPSLVNPKLRVNKQNPDYEGKSLGYWSSYKTISKEARAAYLEWLASNRDDPATPIGFVFLYYYGLERRVLYDIESWGDKYGELPLIIEEVKRLRNIYSDNSSFERYSRSFLEYLTFQDDIGNKLIEAVNQEELDYTKYENSYYEAGLNFRLVLAYYSLNQIPLPPRVALKWGIWNKSLRTPATRCKKEFQKLFEEKYKERFGKGDIVKPNKKKIFFSYHPASNSFGYQNRFKLDIDIPDLLNLESKPRKYYSIVEECIYELDAYSRRLGRGADPNDIQALSQLPKRLLVDKIDQSLRLFIEEVESDLTNDLFVFKNSADLIKLWNKGVDSKLTKKESVEMAQFFSKFDLGLEPDARFDNSKVESGNGVIFFKVEGWLSPKKPSKEYKSALTILHLSVVVGLADGVFKKEEKDYLESYIEELFKLTGEEKKRLHCYLVWLEQSDPTVRGLKSKLDQMTYRDKESILFYLVKLSDADGYIHPKEVEMLQKLANIFEIDKQKVFSLIHSVQANDDEPILVKNKDEAIGYRLPTQPNVNELNKDTITKTLKETEEIQSILSDIFNNEDDEIQTPEPKTEQADKVGKPLLAIDEYHSNLLSKLLEKDEWDRDEYEELCSELNLFPEGALEIINESSFNAYDDELLIDNGVIIINRELLQINNG